MSNSTVIGDIENTLRALLEKDKWEGIIPKPKIIFNLKKDIKDDDGSTNLISLFLYQIIENIHLKNEELHRIDETHLGYPPMHLELLYLVTPYSNDPIQEKLILGKVMQIFFDNAVLSGNILVGNLKGLDEEFKIIFNPLSLDDLTKLWSTFQEMSYKLSVSYLITPVSIDSSREIRVQRVVAR